MGKQFQSINPFDQSLIAEFEIFDDKRIDEVLSNAEKSFSHWRKTDLNFRRDQFIRLASVLRKNKEKYAKTISLEMGKIIIESRAEVEKCAVCCEYFAEHCGDMLHDEIVDEESLVAFDPIGAVFAIMPWNFPFWQVIRFAVPALLAGNVGLLKHAKNVTQCSLFIEEAFVEAGFPDHVFQSLIIESSQAEKIIQHPIVQGVSLTGSENAGSSVASIAGKNIKKTVLELGGSDAFIILDDANLVQAVRIAIKSRMQNAGQSCIAAKRFIVTKKIHDEFIDAFANASQKIKQGNQLDEDNSMGPVCSAEAADKIELQQNNSVKSGAKIISGGNRNGANYEPTIIDQVEKGMPAFDEELFGPVASIIKVENAEGAISIANSHRYGLGATIFTEDHDRAYHFARQIEAGSVFINAMVKSDPKIPFGGVKKSGYGRELSYFGIREFTNIKTIFGINRKISRK